MGEKVVHVPDDAHEAAKKHCKKTGKRMNEWVSKLIIDAVERDKSEIDIHASTR